MVDIASLLNLQARARRNALLAARALHKRRLDAAAAELALSAEPAPTDGSTQPRTADR